MKRFWAISGYLLLLIVLVIFVLYAFQHPLLWQKLRDTSLLELALLFIAYGLLLLVLCLVLKYTLALCRHAIPAKNNLQLTIYSSIINFFGPLQAGPGFRAAYLRAKYKISLKRFFIASAIYYIFLTVISIVCALAGSPYWRWLYIFIPTVILALLMIYKTYYYQVVRSYHYSNHYVYLKAAYKLLFVTFIQVALTATIYTIELTSIDHSITLAQAISYTGVANLSVFIAITPGAIGIREGLLVISRKLHHISTSTIIAANFIDRAVYLAFLGVLFILVVYLHLKEKLANDT